MMILGDGVRAYDNFGAAIAASGSLLAVGAPNTDLEGARNTGAVYLFQYKSGRWQQVARLTPEPAEPDARFGSALALDGDILAVGAPYEYNPRSGNASGAVYIFTRSGSKWTQSARLAGQDGLPFDLFGSSLALQGKDLAVGASAADTLNGRDAGSVYMYRQDGREWTRQARLGADALAFDHFGQALVFSGENLLVGVPDADLPEGANAGQVVVYRQVQAGWAELERLQAAQPAPQAGFGAQLAVLGDWIAVLAPQEYQKPGPVPPYAVAWESTFGVAHVFERAGGEWQPRARLFPEAASENESALASRLFLAGSAAAPRLVIASFGGMQLTVFAPQGSEWQKLAGIELPSFGLIHGMGMAEAESRLLFASSFFDIPQPGGDAVQSAGVIWILDWEGGGQ
jgi:hypothetical protein